MHNSVFMIALNYVVVSCLHSFLCFFFLSGHDISVRVILTSIWMRFSVFVYFLFFILFFPFIYLTGADITRSLNNLLSKQWRAICTENGIVKDAAKQTLNFSDTSLPWSAGTFLLFERNVYTLAYEHIKNNGYDQVLILGTSGIGKSLFVLWYIYKLVCESDSPPSIAYQDREGSVYYLKSENGVHSVYDYHDYYKMNPMLVVDCYISDTSSPPDLNRSNSKFRMHVTSDNNSQYQDFQKEISNNSISVEGKTVVKGKSFHMDVFSEDEALHLGNIRQLTSGKANLGKLVFGGSARHICSCDSEVLNSEIAQFVEEHMKQYFLDVMFEGELVANHAAFVSIVHVVSNVLVRQGALHSAETIAFNSMFRHKKVVKAFELTEEIWASDFMKWLAGSILDHRNKNLLQELRGIFDRNNCAFGIAFERNGHVNVYENLKNGGTYYLKHLTEPLLNIVELKVALQRRVLIRTISDLTALIAGDYGKAIIPNYPEVDAVIKVRDAVFNEAFGSGRKKKVRSLATKGLVVYLQYTAGITHKGKVNSVNNLADMKAHLGGDDNDYVLVFVLDEINFPLFKQQDKLGNISQYKMHHNVTASFTTAR